MLEKAKGTLCRMFSSSATAAAPSPAPRRDDGDLVFMTLVLKVNCDHHGWFGWQRSVSKVLKNCKGVHFQMDGEGNIEVNAIGEANKVLWRIARSRKLKLQWIQYGLCSSNLSMPAPAPASAAAPTPKPVAQNPSNYPYPPYRRHVHEYPQNPSNYPYPPYRGHVYGYPPALGNGYGYERPQARPFRQLHCY